MLTVLYCDIVDYSPLANRLDPEDLGVVVATFHDVAKRVAESYGSAIGGYRGDAILIYFGYPVAEENDTFRAVQAALELARTLPMTPTLPGIRAEVRLGVATGLVVIGDVIESSRAREISILGPVPNLAQRLQAIAPPGGVVMSEATYRLIGSKFDCVDLGPLVLKGFAEPQVAWRAIQEKEMAGHAAASRASADTTPFVGRYSELATLTSAWERSAAGNGRVVVVSGEPGIGKSRICRELRQAIHGKATVLQYLSSPRFSSTALFPVIENLRYHAKIQRRDNAQKKFTKLEALLKAQLPAEHVATTLPYLASLLSVDVRAPYQAIQDSPELLKARTFEALLLFIQHMASVSPVLLILEDAHWADPTTLELIDLLSARVANLNMLVIVATRPQLDAARIERWKAQSLDLQRLNPEDAAKIIANFADPKRLPPRVLGHLLGKGDGVPLFLEEITKTMMESNALVDHGDYFELVTELSSGAVPTSLQESLVARLDRLGPAKDVAQVAAVIGREFSHELLEAVVGEGTAVDPQLDRLSLADLLHPVPNAPQRTYRFKHALIRDAAYDGLLKSKRQQIHGRVATVLEEKLRLIADQEPEFAAHHFTEAGYNDKAIPLWELAASHASARAAYEESVNHLHTAIGLLPSVPEAQARAAELRLQVQLGQNLCTTMGYAAGPVESAYRRARDLAEAGGDYDKQYDPVRGLCTFYIVRDELDHARSLADHCVHIAEITDRIEDRIESGTALGYVQVYMGDLNGGAATLRELVSLYDMHDGPSRKYASAQDPAVAAYTLLAHTEWLRGNDNEAEQCIAAARGLQEAMRRPFNVAYVECYASMLANLRRDYDSALRHAERGIAVATQYGIQIWLGAGKLHSCVARGRLGHHKEAIPELKNTLEFWNLIGARLMLPWFQGELAQCYRESGAIGEAFAMIEAAIRHAQTHAETFMLPDLLRIRAELLALNGEADAEVCIRSFDNAISLAREQQSRVFELRASIARLEFLSSRSLAKAQDRQSLRALAQTLTKQQGFPERELRSAARLYD